MIYAIAMLTQVIISGIHLENEPSRLIIDRGSVISEITSSLFTDSTWQENQVIQADLYGESMLIVLFNWPGNGCCIAVFKVVDSGYLFLGDFTNMFGGNGIDISISRISVSNGELQFVVEWTGHLRGYCSDPDSQDTYVPPEDISSSFIMATNGDTLRTFNSTAVTP